MTWNLKSYLVGACIGPTLHHIKHNVHLQIKFLDNEYMSKSGTESERYTHLAFEITLIYTLKRRHINYIL